MYTLNIIITTLFPRTEPTVKWQGLEVEIWQENLPYCHKVPLSVPGKIGCDLNELQAYQI